MDRINIIRWVLDGTTFLIHLLIAVAFLLLGWISKSFHQFTRNTSFDIPGFLGILAGFSIIILSAYHLFKRSPLSHNLLISSTASFVILWMVLVSAYDMQYGLLGYLMVFIPIWFARRKLDPARDNRSDADRYKKY
jgi:hypothetical protein